MTFTEVDVTARASHPRAARLLGPLATGLVAAVGLAVVYFVDPNQPGHYPLCPFKAVTGLDCPGCGMTRGLHDLLHGHLGRALDHNVLIAFAVPVAALAWFGWLKRAWTGSPVRRELPNAVVYTTIALLLVFWIVRNLPGVPYLGSS